MRALIEIEAEYKERNDDLNYGDEVALAGQLELPNAQALLEYLQSAIYQLIEEYAKTAKISAREAKITLWANYNFRGDRQQAERQLILHREIDADDY